MAFFNVGNPMDGFRAAVEQTARLASRPLMQAQEKQESRRFEELDRDNDGRVTRDELKKGLLGNGEPSSMSLTDHLKSEQLADFALQRHDLDGDGALSVNPSAKRQERLQTQRFKGYDLDRDGQVTKEELRQKVDDDFLVSLLINSHDLDRDGRIDVPK